MDIERIAAHLGMARDDHGTLKGSIVVDGLQYTLFMQRGSSFDGLTFAAVHEPEQWHLTIVLAGPHDDPEWYRRELVEHIEEQHSSIVEWADAIRRAEG